jgi:hypothetical protein
MGGRDIVRRRNEEAKRQHWKCHWCQVEMTPIPPDWPHPPTTVTLDHLYGKGDPRRTSTRNGERRWFAACKRCNERRGKEHEKAFPSEAHALAMKEHQRKAQRERARRQRYPLIGFTKA